MRFFAISLLTVLLGFAAVVPARAAEPITYDLAWTGRLGDVGGTSNEYAVSLHLDSNDLPVIAGYKFNAFLAGAFDAEGGMRWQTVTPTEIARLYMTQLNRQDDLLGTGYWTSFDNIKHAVIWRCRLGQDGEIISFPLNSAGYALSLGDTGFNYWTGVAGIEYPEELFLTRFDAGGRKMWLRMVVAVESEEEAVKTVFDDDGNVSFMFDDLVIRYSSNGVRRWVWEADSNALPQLKLADIATDAAGRLYLVGVIAAPPLSDLVLIRLSTAGTIDYAVTYDGPLGNIEQPSKVSIGPAGEVVVIGDGFTESGTRDAMLLKFEAENGNLSWARYANDSTNYGDTYNNLAFSETGEIAAVGRSGSYAALEDFLISFYDADGNLLWDTLWNGEADGFDNATNVALDAERNLYVFGAEEKLSGRQGLVLLKYQRRCNGCLIDDACLADGAVNPETPCLKCDVAVDRDDWSVANGAPCDDGLFCTGADFCQGGACVHEGDPCLEGQVCSEADDACQSEEDDDESPLAPPASEEEADSGSCGC